MYFILYSEYLFDAHTIGIGSEKQGYTEYSSRTESIARLTNLTRLIRYKAKEVQNLLEKYQFKLTVTKES